MAKKKQDRWLQGYACAVAIYVNLEGGIDVRAQEMLDAAGLDLDTAKAHGVDEGDLDTLFYEPERRTKKREVAHGAK